MFLHIHFLLDDERTTGLELVSDGRMLLNVVVERSQRALK